VDITQTFLKKKLDDKRQRGKRELYDEWKAKNSSSVQQWLSSCLLYENKPFGFCDFELELWAKLCEKRNLYYPIWWVYLLPEINKEFNLKLQPENMRFIIPDLRRSEVFKNQNNVKDLFSDYRKVVNLTNGLGFISPNVKDLVKKPEPINLNKTPTLPRAVDKSPNLSSLQPLHREKEILVNLSALNEEQKKSLALSLLSNKDISVIQEEEQKKNQIKEFTNSLLTVDFSDYLIKEEPKSARNNSYNLPEDPLSSQHFIELMKNRLEKERIANLEKEQNTQREEARKKEEERIIKAKLEKELELKRLEKERLEKEILELGKRKDEINRSYVNLVRKIIGDPSKELTDKYKSSNKPPDLLITDLERRARTWFVANGLDEGLLKQTYDKYVKASIDSKTKTRLYSVLTEEEFNLTKISIEGTYPYTINKMLCKQNAILEVTSKSLPYIIEDHGIDISPEVILEKIYHFAKYLPMTIAREHYKDLLSPAPRLLPVTKNLYLLYLFDFKQRMMIKGVVNLVQLVNEERFKILSFTLYDFLLFIIERTENFKVSRPDCTPIGLALHSCLSIIFS